MFELPLAEPVSLKTCAECAWVIGVRSQLDYAIGWRCGNPSNITSASIDPVTGLEAKTYAHINCGDTRKDENACGQEGRWFKLYERPSPYRPSNKVTPRSRCTHQ